jgi:hypothetical protein
MVSHRVEGLRACAFGAPVCYALHQGGKAQGGGTGDCDWAQWSTSTFDQEQTSQGSEICLTRLTQNDSGVDYKVNARIQIINFEEINITLTLMNYWIAIDGSFHMGQ